MKLIDNARQAWRFLSIQVALIGGAIQAGVMAFPDFHTWVGDTMAHVAAGICFAGVVFSRLISQDKKPDAP